MYKKYDDNGRLVRLTIKEKEYWYEYDDKGNEIHYKDSKGYEEWNEYDDKGDMIRYKNSNGYEWWNEYDDNNSL